MQMKKMNKNGVKLLAAIAVFAMAITGFTVMTAEGSDGDVTVPVSDPFSGMYTAGTASYSSGVFTVTDNTTITLTSDVGSAGSENNMQIKIADGKTLTITSTDTHTIYIAFTTNNYDKAQEGAKR